MSYNTECTAAYSEDCKYLAYSSPDGRLKIWDTYSGALKQEYVPSSHLSAAATCLAWRGKVAAPRHRKQRSRSTAGDGGGDGDLVALGTPAGSVLVYSVTSGELTAQLAGQHTAGVQCVAWAATGHSLFSGGADSHVVHWCLPTGKVKCKLKAGKTGVQAVCPLPDGDTLLTASRTITWWQLATGAALRTYTGHATEVTCLRHVPLPGLDGEGGYFVSAAAAGRVINAWQLSRDQSQQTASLAMALPSEPRDVRVARPAEDGGAVLVTAVTVDGCLHVFERHLNGVRRKPIKPKLTVRVASDGAAARPLPVLSARPGDEQPAQLHLCHGSFLRPTFERLPYQTDEPQLCLVRADPAAAPTTSTDPVSRVKTPAVDGTVRQLAAGHLSTGRKRRTSAADAADATPAQLPMEQRLGALVAPPHGDNAKPPSAANMAQLLMQGLASRDRVMLRTVVQAEDPDVISSTVASLPVESVLPFIDRLGHILRFADQSFSGLKWLRAVIEQHSAFLLTQTDLDSILAPIYSSVQVRLRCYPRLLQLRGRLELISGQVAARQRQAAHQSAGGGHQQPLLSYQDDSSDEDGDLLGLPAPSPGAVSDMSDDEDHNDDQHMEDEDGSDDGSEDGSEQDDEDENVADSEDGAEEDETLVNGD